MQGKWRLCSFNRVEEDSSFPLGGKILISQACGM